jgi:hypothetical protein
MAHRLQGRLQRVTMRGMRAEQVHQHPVEPLRGACLAAAVALVAAALAGCAGYAPGTVDPGTKAADLQRRMGTPTARYSMPAGASRLEFARGPYGKHTYMVDVDAQGVVQRWTQVLTERNFESVPVGISSQDLLVQLGTPSHRRRGGLRGGEVWSWRYNATFCQWFQVDVIEGRVQSMAYGPDPICDVNDDKVGLLRR